MVTLVKYPIEIDNNVSKIISTDNNFNIEVNKMKYRVHRLKIRMTEDPHKLEEFLNSLEGEIVSIIPKYLPYLFCPCRFPANC